MSKKKTEAERIKELETQLKDVPIGLLKKIDVLNPTQQFSFKVPKGIMREIKDEAKKCGLSVADYVIGAHQFFMKNVR